MVLVRSAVIVCDTLSSIIESVSRTRARCRDWLCLGRNKGRVALSALARIVSARGTALTATLALEIGRVPVLGSAALHTIFTVVISTGGALTAESTIVEHVVSLAGRAPTCEVSALSALRRHHIALFARVVRLLVLPILATLGQAGTVSIVLTRLAVAEASIV